MSARITWQGVGEFRVSLVGLPAALADEAVEIVRTHAEGAAAEITAGYPAVTGNLKRGMRVSYFKNPLNSGAEVRNRAPHSWWYDNGTQARHYTTKKNGVRHETGAMWGGSRPPTHLFVRTMIKWRRRFDAAIAFQLRQHDLVVTETDTDAAA